MTRYVLLDAGVVGLLCSSPRVPGVAACLNWLEMMGRAGINILIADVSVYEVRRELVRLRASAKLARLDRLCDGFGSEEVNSEAWSKAADFWAIVRQAGLPTADPHALDADAILAGVAAILGRPEDAVTIATDNIAHLARFPNIDARQWQTIT